MSWSCGSKAGLTFDRSASECKLASTRVDQSCYWQSLKHQRSPDLTRRGAALLRLCFLCSVVIGRKQRWPRRSLFIPLGVLPPGHGDLPILAHAPPPRPRPRWRRKRVRRAAEVVLRQPGAWASTPSGLRRTFCQLPCGQNGTSLTHRGFCFIPTAITLCSFFFYPSSWPHPRSCKTITLFLHEPTTFKLVQRQGRQLASQKDPSNFFSYTSAKVFGVLALFLINTPWRQHELNDFHEGPKASTASGKRKLTLTNDLAIQVSTQR